MDGSWSYDRSFHQSQLMRLGHNLLLGGERLDVQLNHLISTWFYRPHRRPITFICDVQGTRVAVLLCSRALKHACLPTKGDFKSIFWPCWSVTCSFSIDNAYLRLGLTSPREASNHLCPGIKVIKIDTSQYQERLRTLV